MGNPYPREYQASSSSSGANIKAHESSADGSEHDQKDHVAEPEKIKHRRREHLQHLFLNMICRAAAALGKPLQLPMRRLGITNPNHQNTVMLW